MSQRRYLVTGGAGFIGSALVHRLVADGHFVRVLDDGSRGQPQRLGDIAGAFELHIADVRDAESVAHAARDVDAIIHLAAVNGTEFFYSRPELVLDVGVRGMLAVIQACRQHGIRDLVVASSSEVYQTPEKVPTDETVPLVIPDVANPRYSYAGGKIISELMALNYGRTGFDRVVIFRPHNVYGPDMGWEHVIPQFAQRAAAACRTHPQGPLPFALQGDGSQTRSFIHIDDFTEGLALVIARGGHGEIIHIGTEDEISIAELARLVCRHFGREAALQPGPAPSGATPRRCPDITKLRALGFAPRIPLGEGLGPVVDWYARHSRPTSDTAP
ncbi:MAG: NAD-dependent epimerase/dehydratase family protein [Alphaproteobacteria bacterium]|nr:NAD-dependent epimerase/dehydratase family protein [Alphaproteobacteria bacterium]